MYEFLNISDCVEAKSIVIMVFYGLSRDHVYSCILALDAQNFKPHISGISIHKLPIATYSYSLQLPHSRDSYNYVNLHRML